MRSSRKLRKEQVIKNHVSNHPLKFLFIQVRKRKKIADDEIASYCQLGKINRSELRGKRL